MSTRDTIRETPESKGSESPDPSSPDKAVPETTSDSKSSLEKKFDPYKFQANTMPPGLRAELIAVGLPRVDPERIEDTVPPNRVAPAVFADDATGDSTTLVTDESRTDSTLITHGRSRRTAVPTWTIALGAALVACAIVLVLTVPRRSPSVDSQREPSQNAATSQTAAVATSTSAEELRNPAELAISARSALPSSHASVEPPAASAKAVPTSPGRPQSHAAPRTGASHPPTSSDIVRPQPAPVSSSKTNPFDRPFKPPSE